MLMKPLLTLVTSVLLIPAQPTQAPEAPEKSPQETPAQEAPAHTQRSTTNAAKEAPTSPASPSELKKQAWKILQEGAKTAKASDRAAAIHALALLNHDGRGKGIAESALGDDTAEVRSAAAAALGEMGSRSSIPKLRSATDDNDPSVALAAAHALVLLNDNSAYEVYYEVLTGERKTGKGILSQASSLKDPQKLAKLGFEEGIGFIPFAGLGWQAFKTVKKNDSSPVRAAAALVLAKDPDPKTAQILADAAGDKNWVVRAAALEALARRGDPEVLSTVGLYLSDEEGEVKYTAAATALRLIAIGQASAASKRMKKEAPR